MSAYFGIVLIAGLLLGPWVALGFGVVSIAFTGWLAYAEIHQLLPTAPEFATPINFWGEFSSVLISVVGLIALVMRRLQRVRERAKRKEEELAFKLVESEQLAIWAQEASDFKTHLLARVSHELRTPLGVIVGMAEMLRLEAYGSMTDEQKRVLERIQVNSKFLETTFSELLEQSQLDREMLPMQVSNFSPSSILEKVLPELREEAEQKGLRFSEHISPELPETIWGIPGRIEQILFHLANNAIKFTQTGAVEVSLIRRDEERWSMRVTDTGIGIPKEHRESIFEPFRQVDETFAREYGGVGLGLSIVKRLTASMKGTIRVESELGQGSIFTVTLPFIEPDTKSTEL